MTRMSIPVACFAGIATVVLLGGCTISVDEGDYGVSRHDVRRIVCDMVDEDAIEDPDRCDRERDYGHDHD